MTRVPRTAPANRPARGEVHAGLLGFVASVLVSVGLFGGAGGPGLRLFRDFVAVPGPGRPQSILPGTWAELRAWPLDGVAWALSGVLPPGWQQWLMLLAVPVLAGTGTAILVAPRGRAPAVVAAVLASWNPYVVERLLLGQPPTLLAYAALPWVALAARSRVPSPGRAALLLTAALPAALTPWGGLMAAGVAIGATVSQPARSRTALREAVLVSLLWCLPWLVPALVVGPSGNPDVDGAAAFRLADDTGLGTLWSALTGGGVWSSAAVPSTRHGAAAGLASAALLALAVLGGLRLKGKRRWQALIVLLGPATMLALLSGPALTVFAHAQGLPGVALFRDQHRLLGVAALSQAILVACLVERLQVPLCGWRVLPVVAGAASIAVLACPDAPRLTSDAYRTRVFPADWTQFVADVDAEPGSVVISFPWQPLRQPAWAAGSTFLDPTPRALPGRVMTSSELRVRRDGQVLVVDDAPSGDATEWSAGRVSVSSLRAHRVTHVLEWLGTPGQLPDEVSKRGWQLVRDGSNWRLWRVNAS